MATSGTFTGDRGGSSTGPYLTLEWRRTETDISNNRSKIRLTLRLHANYRINFSANKSGKLHGSSFTYTRGASGTGSWVLHTRDVWVNHNSDGTKSQSFSASFNIAISWSRKHVSSLSVSGTAHITAIPRASTLTAFSFNAPLKNGVANSIKYTVDRKSGNFRHQIQLRDGGTTLWTWDNQNTDGSNSISLSASRVNTLLNRMRNTTSKTFTLRIATRRSSGGSFIGSAVSRNATARVHADVKPSVGSLSLSQTGNSVSSHYLQGKSKVKASFTRSAGYGASITNSSITVRRKSGGADSQTINSNSGTTSRAVSLSGTYEARGMARDSRGRTTYTAWTEFTVTAYNAPRITNFTAVRSSSTPTTVNISRAGTHTPLGGSNPLTYTVQRRTGTGAWTNVDTNATGTSTSSSFSGTSTSTGNAVTSSYDFRLVITDKFGERAESVITVSTQRVVLDIHKNEGVGVGKIHEQGVLDVDGEAYFAGPVHLDEIISNHAGHETDLNTLTKTGFYHVGSRAENAPVNSWGFLYVNAGETIDGLSVSQIFHARSNVSGFFGRGAPVYVRVMDDNRWYDWRLIGSGERGGSSNGEWVRLPDGTQIVFGERSPGLGTTRKNQTVYQSELFRFPYPKQFVSQPIFTGDIIRTTDDNSIRWLVVQNRPNSTTYTPNLRMVSPYSSTATGYRLEYIAIGRWK